MKNVHRKNESIAALLALLLGACAPATSGRPAENAKPMPLKAGIDQNCLRARAEADPPDANALAALGTLDQVRGDLKGAMEKYRKAVSLGFDVARAPIDLTLVGEVIWIQNGDCAVPVPEAAEAASVERKAPEIAYPEALKFIRAEGNARPRVWIGEDGRPSRIAILEATSALPQFVRQREMHEEQAERFLSRVQFALVTIDALRSIDFGKESAGKVWEHKYVYEPPKTMEEQKLPRPMHP